MCQRVFQSGRRHELFKKSPDGSTLRPDLRMAVLRAINLETGTPIRRLGCHPAPGEMQILDANGISIEGSSQQWRNRHQKKRKNCLQKDKGRETHFLVLLQYLALQKTLEELKREGTGDEKSKVCLLPP